MYVPLLIVGCSCCIVYGLGMLIRDMFKIWCIFLPLIPNDIGEKLLKERGEYYTDQYDIKWAFCKFMWESHLELPHIDLDDLEEFVINI